MKIFDADKYAYSLGYQHLAIMPSYSNARDLALDFLKLLVSDRGSDIILQYAGSPSPFKQKYTDEEAEKLSLNEFRKAKIAFARTGKYITYYETSPIRYKAGAANYMVNIPEDVIPEGNITPEQIYNAEAENAQAMWSSWLMSAGLVRLN